MRLAEYETAQTGVMLPAIEFGKPVWVVRDYSIVRRIPRGVESGDDNGGAGVYVRFKGGDYAEASSVFLDEAAAIKSIQAELEAKLQALEEKTCSDG